MPPALLMRSTAIWTPTKAVLPMIAAAPDSGCMVPILYGLAAPRAEHHGSGESPVPSPTAPPAAADRSSRRRVRPPRRQIWLPIEASLLIVRFSPSSGLFALALLKATGGVDRRICQDTVRTGAFEPNEAFDNRPFAVKPTVLRSCVQHRVLAADLIGVGRHPERVFNATNHIEIGHAGFDHHHVSAL